tara:strand:+ start:93 stop:314 length:222 start_codon:yes stop_codon:yes gene_type:complete
MDTKATKLSDRHGKKQTIEAFEPSQILRRDRPSSNFLAKTELNPQKQWLKISPMEGSSFFLKVRAKPANKIYF